MLIDSETMLALAGMLHFLQLPSTFFLIRGTLNLGGDFHKLSAINARIVAIFIGAVGFLLLGLGLLVSARAHELLTTPLGGLLCLLLAAFWLARASAQAWLFGSWPRRAPSDRAWYFGLFALYLYLAVSYVSATVHALSGHIN